MINERMDTAHEMKSLSIQFLKIIHFDFNDYNKRKKEKKISRKFSQQYEVAKKIMVSRFFISSFL